MQNQRWQQRRGLPIAVRVFRDDGHGLKRIDSPCGAMSTGHAGPCVVAATQNERTAVLTTLGQETDTQADRIRSGLLRCEPLRQSLRERTASRNVGATRDDVRLPPGEFQEHGPKHDAEDEARSQGQPTRPCAA